MTFDFSPQSVAVVLGTRPEVIKLAGIIERLGPAARLIHTGQHWDHELNQIFFSEFRLPDPAVQLSIGGDARGQQIGEAAALLSEDLAHSRPRALVVQGDTNATLAGALAANANTVPVMHVEAGLRSFDRRMPEEHNRILTDHLSALCCAATPTSKANLEAEGITGSRVVVTGNTVVEALEQLLPHDRSELLERFEVTPNEFVLATFHRPENVDSADPLRAILSELAALPLPVVLPLHPRTAARVNEFGLESLLTGLRVVEPIGYRDFLGLAAESALLVSDSGGIQEEASVLKRPVIVVRRSTERPEVLGTFATLVEPGDAIGIAAQSLLADLDRVHGELAQLPSPYGDGTASQRCVAALTEYLT
ncbi:MAG: UDP-N-acetylglucosamine 2-epimerase (non-hydrolyzing) [Acidimicrobiia bacterium]|nr:UDP-N-acetylglucosamine 2-epimerase (non-hydrolyzing) [Acidimicrobiia bacterium]